MNQTRNRIIKRLYGTATTPMKQTATVQTGNDLTQHQKTQHILQTLFKKTLNVATSQTISIADRLRSLITTTANTSPSSVNESSNRLIDETDSKYDSASTALTKEADSSQISGNQSIQMKTQQIQLRRNAIEEQTRQLCLSIKKATSVLVKIYNLELLNKHLYEHNEARNTAIYDENFIGYLKSLKNNDNIKDKNLIGQINECLTLLGCVPKIKRRGVNILSLDGGGSKGLVTIEILKNIQKKCDNKPIHELFDYICGTSTGAIIACLLGIYKFSLDECEAYYKLFAKEIFSRNTAVGLGNLVMQMAYYDTQIFEKMLKEAMNDRLLIESARDSRSPRISIVSNLLSDKLIKIFLFRNYTLPLNSTNVSHYDGTHKYCVWQAVRATSAAPFYYEDFKIEGFIFNDGGVLANNPTAIAMHECKHLWPNDSIQSVVSIGNGRYHTTHDYESLVAKCDSLTFKQKVSRIVAGVINTENVHMVLHDLLPPKIYFRFNPYMSEEFTLDENREEKWKLMQHDTQMYMRRNDYKFNMAAKQLLLDKTPVQRAEQFLLSKF